MPIISMNGMKYYFFQTFLQVIDTTRWQGDLAGAGRVRERRHYSFIYTFEIFTRFLIEGPTSQFSFSLYTFL
jgi:hypothetical protein